MNNQKLVFLLLGFLFAPSILAQTKKVAASEWIVYSDNNEVTEWKDTVFQGKPSIRLDSKKQAIAVRKGISQHNTRIDLDVAGEVMSGIGFRMSDNQNYQFLYFRPGYGGTREAIQYVPIYNGTLSWVLYNYPTYETSADIKKLEWFHATLDIRGTSLKVFVNYSQTPQMDITLIDGEYFKDGGILLRSMFGTSYFANVSIREQPDLLTDWEVSEQFSRKPTLDIDYAAKSATWTKTRPDDGGVVNISKLFKTPDGVAIARHKIKSESEQERMLFFDFSGKLRIVLNGTEVFRYEKYVLDRDFAGTYRIKLNLKKGDNDLIFVTEGDSSFFGKGFSAMGRLQHQNWGFFAELGR